MHPVHKAIDGEEYICLEPERVKLLLEVMLREPLAGDGERHGAREDAGDKTEHRLNLLS